MSIANVYILHMKIIRLIFFSIITFFVIACIISFFIPSRITVVRMVKVDKQKRSLLNKVNDLAQWKSWYPGFSKFNLKDTKTDNGKTIIANANGVLLEIKNTTDSSVTVAMEKGGRITTAIWQMDKDLISDSLVFQNYMDFHLKWYPWEKFYSLLLDKTYGTQMMQGLQNLSKQ